ncbi:MAG: cupin protein [Thermoleophilia bacterium]|nr:cupin protein [Thermoleophilia bacterium]
MKPPTEPHPLLCRLADLTPPGSSTSTFEGAEHASQSSFYVSHEVPGEGPDLHTHPYTETFVIIAGHVRFTVGEAVIDTNADDVLVVPPHTPHGFTNMGSEPMRSVNIHAAARMQQVHLESRRRDDGSYELLA